MPHQNVVLLKCSQGIPTHWPPPLPVHFRACGKNVLRRVCSPARGCPRGPCSGVAGGWGAQPRTCSLLQSSSGCGRVCRAQHSHLVPLGGSRAATPLWAISGPAAVPGPSRLPSCGSAPGGGAEGPPGRSGKGGLTQPGAGAASLSPCVAGAIGTFHRRQSRGSERFKPRPRTSRSSQQGPPE